jgi:protoheme IX farnesyltransferase
MKHKVGDQLEPGIRHEDVQQHKQQQPAIASARRCLDCRSGHARSPLAFYYRNQPWTAAEEIASAPPTPGPARRKRAILPFVALTATSQTGTEPLAAAAATAARPSLLADYATLFKLRVSAMVLITAAAGFYLGSLRSGISPFNAGIVKALFGIAVVTCGASALNQALERGTDRLMLRTRNRPMAAGRISLAHGLIVGFLGVFLGSLYLARATNPLTGTLTLLTAVAYVAIYTPLKRVSTINTFIGAFPGALPPLIGWTAARGLIEWPGIALFAILFVWQFPHFMAIGWMYREDYARAGIRLTATLADTRYAARSTVVQAIFYATLMVAVSLWPFALGTTGATYAAAAALLSLGYLWYTIRFSQIGFGKAVRSPHLSEANAQSDCQPARDLLHASIIYLPLLLAAMMLGARGRLLF